MPVLTKINTNSIADDAVTGAKIPAGAVQASEIAAGGVSGADIGYLGDGSGNLSGTITNQQLHFGSAFTLTDNLTVNGDLTLGKVRDDGTGQSITGDGKTITGTGTFTMGGYLEGGEKDRVVTAASISESVITGSKLDKPYGVSGGIETTYSGYKVHTFLSSGILFVDTLKTVDILAVGAGGAGGASSDSDAGGGGGGGGGALKILASHALSAGNYTVIVGAGGLGPESDDHIPQKRDWDGGNSSFGTILIAGGGGAGGMYSGGSWTGHPRYPISGGKGSHGILGSSAGGGAGQNVFPGGTAEGTGVAASGNGGNGVDYSGGGGGGASEDGGNGSGNGTGGNGGNGGSNNYRTGSNITYATGGGGAPYHNGTVGNGGGDSGGGNENQHNNWGGQGQSGQRDNKKDFGAHGGNAKPNTGSGGGGGGGKTGGGGQAGDGGNGGSGIVVIRYAI